MKNMNDYQCIRALSKCKPENDFTCLCQVICTEGATECLSENIQTIPFERHVNLEELFHELESRLISKTAHDTFHKMCRHPIPYPPNLEACTQDFQSINNDWKCHVAKYGQYTTALFFRRCNQTTAYYLLTIHPDLFTKASKGIKDNECLPDLLCCHWAAVPFENQLHTQTLKSMFREQRLLPPSRRVEALPLGRVSCYVSPPSFSPSPTLAMS